MENTLKIRRLSAGDLEACVELLLESYNPPPWNDRWTPDSGKRYLSEFMSHVHFFGFAAVESETMAGALFAHRKTWWTHDELFIDELFIKPEFQRRGYGRALLEKIEALSKAEGLGGVTLLTNRDLPAKAFYEKSGFTAADHIVFLFKKTG
ncbi:MAG: GNAT family N-acetyltransferase [Anaerolineales bacterium]|nr:GNAT family N-acetyltransferase [Anaerolineales bacterium]